jgi:hypothetical protein
MHDVEEFLQRSFLSEEIHFAYCEGQVRLR